MDGEAASQGSTSEVDVNSFVPIISITVPEPGLSRVDLLERISSDEDVNGDIGWAFEALSRVELDLACFSEKLLNLNVLVMHVATRESDIESSASGKQHVMIGLAHKALDFDILSGILDSEVRELDSFLLALQIDIRNTSEAISSLEYLGESFFKMKEKLLSFEESVLESQDQVSEMRMQSAKFQNFLSCLDAEENLSDAQGVTFLEDDKPMNMEENITMQTAEQQRNILKMLEKSLAIEMDLENKLNESRYVEEELRMKLLFSEQEVLHMEDEAVDAFQRFFESYNSSEILIGTSHELLGRLQALQLDLKRSVKREKKLRTQIKVSAGQLESRDCALQKLGSNSAKLTEFLVAQTENLKASLKEDGDRIIILNSEALTLRERVSSLEEQLKEYESHISDVKASADGCEGHDTSLHSQISDLGNIIEDLKEKVAEEEIRAETAEAKCKLLSESNMDFTEELSLLKRWVTLGTVEALENQLKETNIQLQHAEASVEASQEKQKMLMTKVKEMESLIEDVKSKVLKAEDRAENAEERLVMVSDSNAELNEELSSLRGRLESLEEVLHQVKETKKKTAKDISLRTKVIGKLVMQLAIERERLHQQISALSVANKILAVKLKQTENYPSFVNSKDDVRPKHVSNTASCVGENKDEVTDSAATKHQTENKKDKPVFANEVTLEDSSSNLETLQRIDIGALNFKHISMAVLVVSVSMVAYLLQQQKFQF